MYTGHFGLDDGPFHGKAEGQEVYIGEQQATVIARLRKVLASADTAVAVSGPVGVGKSTLVRRALAELAGNKIIVQVDRMRLEPDEVLDLLLSRFDVSRPPKGTVQRVAAFRRLLHERLANDARVFIVVEDAERVGVDALLELEALTATDGGEPVGANIVLMGACELSEFLGKPALARLRQRIRLRQAIAPFDEAEVEGYMRHCLESAGGVLEQIFEPGTARIVYRYSGGIARVVDNLCEAALMAAAEAGLVTILPEFLQEVAENCGLERVVAEVDAPVDIPVEAGEPAGNAGEETGAEAAADAEVEAEPEPEPEPEAEFPAPPAPLSAPPKLALVESLPSISDEAASPEAGDLQDSLPPQPDTTEEPVFHLPVIDRAPDCTGEAEPAQQADEWRSANVTVSRIDEVLPELIERLQSHARGRTRTSADGLQQVVPSTADSAEIPTLSNSMRVAVLPVRPMEERPWIGEREAHSGDSTGIAPALPEAGAGAEPETEMAVDPIAEAESVEAAAEDIAGQEALQEAETAEHEAAAAAVVDDERVTDEPAPDEPAADERGVDELVADASDEPTADEPTANAPAADPAAFELSPAAEDESPVSVLAGEGDEEVTTEAVVLSFDEDLLLAPDAATDVFAAGEASDGVAAEESGLDALEAAIEAANAWQASESEEHADQPAQAPPQATDLPEITLDVELDKRKPASNDLDRWADELSKAKSLEDISDILAETIFGNEEVEAISAEIRAKKAAERAAETGAVPAGTAAKPAAGEPQAAATKAPAPRPAPMARASTAAIPRPQPNTPGRPAAGAGSNMTMSQRIEMVNSLKGRKPLKPVAGMQVSEIVLGEHPDEPLPLSTNGPQPIEAQIDTAITQSRKVLSEADLARLASSDDDDGDKGKRGLFGLFRRSSKS